MSRTSESAVPTHGSLQSSNIGGVSVPLASVGSPKYVIFLDFSKHDFCLPYLLK